MDFKRKYATLLVVLVSLSALAEGDRNTIDSSTARSLGMGNAGVNSERGPHSVFYNPANIAAKNTGSVFQIANFSFEANEGMVIQSQRGSMSVLDLPTLYQSTKAYPNSFQQMRVSIYPNVTIRNFSLGFLYELNRGGMYREIDGSFFTYARDRIGPVAALSFRLFSGIFRIGAVVQMLGITEGSGFTNDVSSLSWDKNMKSGMSYTKTVGTTITFPYKYLPSFSLVARDIGGSTFSNKPLIGFPGTGTPTPKKMSYDFGTSLTYYLGKNIESVFEFDYVDVKNNTKSNRIQRVHLGSEIKLFDLIYLRGGYMHGWPTAGLGIGTKTSSLNLSWYSDNIEDRVRGFRDQRYVLQYVSSIFGGK